MRAIVNLRTGLAWGMMLAAAGVAASAEPGAEKTGLAAARASIAKLLPLALEGTRLALDRAAWDKLRESEPTEPDRLKAFRREKVAARFGKAAVEKWNDQQVDQYYTQHVNRPVPQELFEDVMLAVSGGSSSSSSSQSWSGSQRTFHTDGRKVAGHLSFDMNAKTFSVRFTEKEGAGRVLECGDEPGFGLSLRLSNRAAQTVLLLSQDAGGRVQLVSVDGGKAVARTAASFVELLHEHPADVETLLFGRLADVGIESPLGSFMPGVIAQATGGYGELPADVAAAVDLHLGRLSADDVGVRDRATAELGKLFPSAAGRILAAAASGDAEVKSRVALVADAHPDILRARAYVESLKLHEDRKYLLGVLAKSPAYKAAARARLAQLYGKDYGDDPAGWPEK